VFEKLAIGASGTGQARVTPKTLYMNLTLHHRDEMAQVRLGGFVSVTTPPEIIPYYRLNHSIWSLGDNKESSR
jgi:hypothetical protein